jgi:heptosyltransferase-1
LGDVVRCLPILFGLRERFPRAHISWLVRPDCGAILKNNPQLDEIIEFDRQRWGQMVWKISAAGDFFRFLRKLRKKQYDLVLDLQGLFRSGFISFCSGAAERVGFAHARELAWFFYTHRISIPDEKEHVVDSYWRFAQYLGFGDMKKQFDIPVESEVAHEVRKLLCENELTTDKPYLVMLVGGTECAKRWSPEKFALLADSVRNRYDIKTVLLGAGGEERQAARKVLENGETEIIDLVDKTSLPQAVALMRYARLVVGNDSGPLHIAAALAVPLVGLYGPTDPIVVGPYGQSDGVVQAGASQRRTQRYSPKPEHDIDNITVDEVMQTVHKKLETIKL